MDYSKDEFVKETGLSEKDLYELKEAYVTKYANLKGWDSSKLSQEQLTEIYQQDDYKKAGLLLS